MCKYSLFAHYILTVLPVSSDKFQLLLYTVEAPLSLRFKRFQGKFPSAKAASSIEEFVALDDHVNFSLSSERNVKVIRTFINNEESPDLFFLALSSKSPSRGTKAM